MPAPGLRVPLDGLPQVAQLHQLQQQTWLCGGGRLGKSSAQLPRRWAHVKCILWPFNHFILPGGHLCWLSELGSSAELTSVTSRTSFGFCTTP